LQGNKEKTNTQHTNLPNIVEETGLQGLAFIKPITIEIRVLTFIFLNFWTLIEWIKLKEIITIGSLKVMVFKGSNLGYIIFTLVSISPEFPLAL
jgi:hypothetical protein